MKGDRVTVAAGSFAYRWFLSLFPVVIVLLGFSAAIGIPHHVMVQLVHGVTRALPSGAAGVLTTAMQHSETERSGAVPAIVIAGLVAVWSATSGMVVVEQGLDMAYDIPTDRSFLAKRLRAIPLLLCALLLGGAASVLVVFGQAIGDALRSTVPIDGGAFVLGWTLVRWVVAIVLVELLLSVTYYLAPNRLHSRWEWISPGAVVATVLWGNHSAPWTPAA